VDPTHHLPGIRFGDIDPVLWILLEVVQAGNLSAQLPILIVGCLTAALSGYLCIRFLLSFLQRHKLYVFAAAVKRDLAWYAAVGALNSVIAVYYYARVMKTMVIDEPEGEPAAIAVSWANQALVWVMLVPTAALALVWDYVQKLTGGSLNFFIGG